MPFGNPWSIDDESGGEPVFVRWRTDGTIIEASPAFASLMGFSNVVVMLNRNLVELSPEPERADQVRRTLVERLQLGLPAYAEQMMKTREGHRKYFFIALPVRDSAGNLEYVDGYGFETTTLRSANSTLRTANAIVENLRHAERTNLSGLLHDTVIQALYAARWQVEQNTQVASALDGLIAYVRGVAADLSTNTKEIERPHTRTAKGAPNDFLDAVALLDYIVVDSSDVYALFDSTGVQRWRSASSEAVLGFPVSDEDPTSIAVRTPSDDLQRIVVALSTALEGFVPPPVSWRYEHPDGRTRFFTTSFAPFRHDGELWVTTLSREEPRDVLEAIRAEERNRLGAWLHDDAVQQLVALEWTAPEELRPQIAEIAARMRDESRRLRSPLSTMRLSEALRILLGSSSTPVTHSYDPRVTDVLPRAIAEVTYRVIAEGLRNVDRHANADRVEVRIEHEGLELAVSVRDFGRGLSATDAPQRPGQIGLRSLADDVAHIGGELLIEDANPGTRLYALLPLRG